MKLLTQKQIWALISNGRARLKQDGGFDPHPVVKLFTPETC